MQLGNSTRQWGTVTKTLHWVIVALIIVQYTLAEVADDLPLGLQKFTTLARHKSIGLTIFGLALLRLLWRWTQPTPPLPDTLRPWEKRLASATHFTLYALLFAMPITGWLMSSAANFPVSWFGVFTLPDLVSPDRELQDLLHDVHENLFRLLVALAVLHAAAALKHHFWLKDDVLRRMLPFGRVQALLLCALLLPALALGATGYAVDAGKSSLGFTASQTGAEFDGRFAKFTAQIAFAPDDLAGSSFDVLVDTRSVDTQDDERDTALRGADLLSVEKFPQAHFVSTGFARKGNAYEVTGKLTLRDVTREIRVPFTFTSAREGGRESAWLKGSVQLKRLDFGVGQGDWQDTTWVANEVTVKFTLHLLPSAAQKPAAQKPAAPAHKPKATDKEQKPTAAHF